MIVPKKYFVIEAGYYPKDSVWTQNIKAYNTLHDAKMEYYTRMGALMASKQAAQALLYIVSSDGNKIDGDAVETSYVDPEAGA